MFLETRYVLSYTSEVEQNFAKRIHTTWQLENPCHECRILEIAALRYRWIGKDAVLKTKELNLAFFEDWISGIVNVVRAKSFSVQLFRTLHTHSNERGG
jgi:hypothetical protein